MSETGTPAGPGRRLHPASLFFELLAQARQIVPTWAGAWYASVTDRFAVHFARFLLLAGIFMVVAAVIRALTTRYWLLADEIVLRHGLLFRRVRHIPYARVQNATLQQNVLHRLSRLYTVRLETGAGAQADADLRVLGYAEARRIESAVRMRGGELAATAADADSAVQDNPDRTIIRLGLGEVLLAGVVLDRGFLLVAAAVFGAFQLDLPGLDPGYWLRELFQWLLRWMGGMHAGTLVLAACAFLLLVKVLTLLLSMSQALLHWYGFRLERDGPRLCSDSGLFTRARASATPERVQIVSIYDGLWLRLLRRRAVGVSVSGASTALNAERGLDWLAPINAEARTEMLVRSALPDVDLHGLQWHSLHHATGARLARRSLLFHSVLALPLLWWSWKFLPVVLVLALFGQVRAWLWTRYAAWACDGVHLAWRSGISSRVTWIVRLDRLAGATLAQNPFDRRHEAARLRLDTQAPQRAHALELSYLPREVAEQLALQVRRAIQHAEGTSPTQSA